MIINLLRLSKKHYYSSFFEEHQGNVKKTWEGIRTLINVSKKKGASPTKLIYENEVKNTDYDIANSFNNFFTSVGSTIEGKIPAAKRDFSSFLGDHNEKNVFLTPCDNEEILSLLAQMISSKASGPNSIPTNLLVEFRSQLVHPHSYH